jgi:hypothetical protein
MSLHYQKYTFKNFLDSSARLFYPLREGGEGRKEGKTWEETEEDLWGDKESSLLDT